MVSPSDADHKLAVLHENFLFEFAVEGLSEPEAIYLSVCRFRMEAHNGGIKQFFANSSGVFTPYPAGCTRENWRGGNAGALRVCCFGRG